jgi:MFS family permease
MTATAPRRRGGLWRHRDFRILWIGETASQVGSSVTGVALPLVAVETLHASAFLVTALTAGTWLPWLFLGLPAGGWVDRLPRRPVMLACDGLSLAAFVSVPIAAWLGVLTIPQLLGAALVAGGSSVFFKTAYGAYLPSIVDRRPWTRRRDRPARRRCLRAARRRGQLRDLLRLPERDPDPRDPPIIETRFPVAPGR